MLKRERIQPLQVYQLLPRTNCKLCGLPGCYAFAFALIGREKTIKDCPELESEAFSSSLQTLNEYFGGEGVVEKTGLLINKEKCNGCGDCVIVCNKALYSVASHEAMMILRRPEDELPPVLEIVDGVVQVACWSSCKRCGDPPAQCRVCEEKCLFGALELVRKGDLAPD